MRKKKVVQLVEDMGVGGLERNLALIVENLNPSLFDVSVWCLEEGGYIAHELQQKGFDVIHLNLPNYHNPVNILKLAKLLREHEVDILHTHEYFANTMGRLAAILAGTPKRFAHIQNSHWPAHVRKKRHYRIDKFLSWFCDHVIACSEMARKFQVEVEGLHPDKVVTVHNCTDLALYDPSEPHPGIREEFGFTSQNILIASIARLTRVKGHRFLIEAAPAILEEFPECRILIAGYGIERENLEKQVQELSLEERVLFLGTRHDIPNVLSSIDLFVQPTLIREGLPLAITEAMASGTAVVATDVGGVSEAVLHKKTGILVPPGDRNALADGILFLLRNPSFRHAMAMNGRQHCIEQYGSKTMIGKIEALYGAELLAG